jgi:orotate phosphoribosyltransferase-like protein
MEEVLEKREEIANELSVSQEDANFLVFTGEAENSLYNPNNERINILFKDGDVRDISQVDSPLIHQNLSHPVKKFYICFYQHPVAQSK